MAGFWPQYVQPLGNLLLPLLLAAILLSLGTALVARLATGQSLGNMLLYLSPFSWLGGVTGLIAGASQEAIVGAFVTGMLTVVTGLFSFMFAKDALAEWRPVLSLAVVLLCISAVIGLSFGRIYKKDWDAYERDRALWAMRFEHADVPVLAVKARYDYCRRKISPSMIQQCDGLLVK